MNEDVADATPVFKMTPRTRNRFTLALVVGALFIVALAVFGPARSQVLCGPHAAIVEHLKKSLGEVQVGVGMMGQIAVVEFLLSETGTWTVLRTTPNGTACIIATGHSWEETNIPGQDA